MSEWWRDLFQQTIDCYPDDRDQGMRACEQLLSIPGLPWSIEEATRRNQTWYCQRLDSKGWLTHITFPHREGWSLFNPSIATNGEGDIRAIVRSSNYQINAAGRYVIPDGDHGVIKTENYFLNVYRTWGEERDFSWNPPTLIPDPDMPTNDFPVRGIEDCRLFSAYGGWRYTGTVRNLNPSGICQQIRANVATDWWRVLSPPREHNKNWMPTTDARGSPVMIDRCYPLVMRDMIGGSPVMKDSPYVARSFRGGAITYLDDRDAYLAVVHESITMEPYEKIYTHRFVEIDALTESITRISDPFVFEGRQIEFCAGMAQVGDDLVLSYGTNDAEAHLLRIPLTTALGMLREPLREEVPG